MCSCVLRQYHMCASGSVHKSAGSWSPVRPGRKGHMPTYDRSCCAVSGDDHKIVRGVNGHTSTFTLGTRCMMCLCAMLATTVTHTEVFVYSHWESVLLCGWGMCALVIRNVEAKKGPIARKQMGSNNQDASTNDLSLRIICWASSTSDNSSTIKNNNEDVSISR